MAVIDADEVAIGVVRAGDRLPQLRRIYLVPRFWRRMDVPAADQPIRDFPIAKEKPAAFARRRLARVRDDLVAKPAR